MTNLPDHERNLEVRRAVLDILEKAEPYALPLASLHTTLNVRLRPPMADEELEINLTYLRAHGLVDTLREDLDENALKYLITETGKAVLRK